MMTLGWQEYDYPSRDNDAAKLFSRHTPFYWNTYAVVEPGYPNSTGVNIGVWNALENPRTWLLVGVATGMGILGGVLGFFAGKKR